MTRSRFIEVSRQHNLDFACLMAQAVGISTTQIELWRITAARQITNPA